MAKNPPVFDMVKNWLDKVSPPEKTASAKSAASKDPGGYSGPTSHPSKEIDNNTHETPEGARSRENEEDVKRDVPASVDATTPGGGGDEESKMPNIGLHQTETGKDPKVEDDYKGTKDDPGTTHPANAEDVGDKYASLVESNKIDELLKLHKQASDSLLAALTVKLHEDEKVATVTPARATTPKTTTKSENTKAAEAGYKLAEMLGMTKESADQAAEAMVAHFVKEATSDADRVGPFFVTYVHELQKKAEGEMPPGMPPPGMDPAAGGMPPPGAEGPPPGPPGAEGGMPPGAEGPPGGGEGGQLSPEVLQQIIAALQEAGIHSPEQLLGMGGAGGGEAPPSPEAAAAGPPAEKAGSTVTPKDMLRKLAAVYKDVKGSSKYKYEPAKTAAQQKYRDEMSKYVLELVAACH